MYSWNKKSPDEGDLAGSIEGSACHFFRVKDDLFLAHQFFLHFAHNLLKVARVRHIIDIVSRDGQYGAKGEI